MWATAADVKERWIGGDIPVADGVLETLIGDAEDAILAAVPDLETRVPVEVPLERARRVVSRMVIRVLRNPEGIRTLQETTGQFSGSTTFAGDNLGEIVFTDADRRDLLGRGPTGRRAFSVMPGGVR